MINAPALSLFGAQQQPGQQPAVQSPSGLQQLAAMLQAIPQTGRTSNQGPDTQAPTEGQGANAAAALQALNKASGGGSPAIQNPVGMANQAANLQYMPWLSPWQNLGSMGSALQQAGNAGNMGTQALQLLNGT